MIKYHYERINRDTPKIQNILKRIQENKDTFDIKSGNLESFIKGVSSNVEEEDYSSAMSGMQEMLNELNEYGLKLMKQADDLSGKKEK